MNDVKLIRKSELIGLNGKRLEVDEGMPKEMMKNKIDSVSDESNVNKNLTTNNFLCTVRIETWWKEEKEEIKLN